MDYMQEYEKWLASPALTPEEHAELESIRGDEKEIRERFYGPLEFGTAGLRGTMKVGLHQMNVHVIRWATQGFANVICAEGEDARRRGVALCMDCRNHSMEFARPGCSGGRRLCGRKKTSADRWNFPGTVSGSRSLDGYTDCQKTRSKGKKYRYYSGG